MKVISSLTGAVKIVVTVFATGVVVGVVVTGYVLGAY